MDPMELLNHMFFVIFSGWESVGTVQIPPALHCASADDIVSTGVVPGRFRWCHGDVMAEFIEMFEILTGQTPNIW